MRTVGARMLPSFGFTALAAPDGRQALEIYREHREEITLVLLDLTMPHMECWETLPESCFTALTVLRPARVGMLAQPPTFPVQSRLHQEAPWT